MNITSYIVKFLKKGNPVEIPGIGTLQLKIIGAQYQESTGEFSPAIKTIIFTNTLRGKDEIIDYVALKECVSHKTAAKMWHNYVEALKEKLNKERTHVFEDIGSLEQASGGEYSFIVNEEVNLFETNFGLHALSGIKKIEAKPLENNPFDYTPSLARETNTNSPKESMSEKEISDDAALLKQKLDAIIKKLDEDVTEIHQVVDELDPKSEEVKPEPLGKTEEPLQTEEVVEKQKRIKEEDPIQGKTVSEIVDTKVQEEEPKKSVEAKASFIKVESKPKIEKQEETIPVEEEKPAKQAPKKQPKPEKIKKPKKEKSKKVKSPKQKVEKQGPKSSGKAKYIWVAVISIFIVAAGAYQYLSMNDKIPSVCSLIKGSETPVENITKEKPVESNVIQGNYRVSNLFVGDQKHYYGAVAIAAENEGQGIFSMKKVEKELSDQFWKKNRLRIGENNQPKVLFVEKKPVEKKPGRRHYTPKTVSQPTAGFDLISGLFKVKSNALKQADEVAQRGLNPHIIEVMRNGELFYYVSLGYRNSYTEIEVLRDSYWRMKGIEMVITRW